MGMTQLGPPVEVDRHRHDQQGGQGDRPGVHRRRDRTAAVSADELGRERQGGDDGQQSEVEAQKPAIQLSDHAEQAVVGDPLQTDDDEAEEIPTDGRERLFKGMAEFSRGQPFGNGHVKGEQGDGDSEDGVRERLHALDVDPEAVGRSHR
jgi:hypothetical protein